MCVVSVIYSFYYNIITTWILYYLVNSFFYPLPWSTCGNSWNTKNCVDERHNTNSNVKLNTSLDSEMQPNETLMINFTLDNTMQINNNLVTPEEEFWEYV